MFAPVAAVFTAFFIAAVPAVLFMGIWAAVMAFRLLRPEQPLPFDAAVRREAARRRGQSVRVGYRDIEEDLRLRPVRPAFSRRQAVPEGAEPTEGWREDLWRRRN